MHLRLLRPISALLTGAGSVKPRRKSGPRAAMKFIVSARLNERLRAAGYGKKKGQASSHVRTIGSLVSAAAGFVAAGYLAVAFFGSIGPVNADLALAPVVATATEPEPPPINIYAPETPAIVASVSAGLPVWPAAMVAAQAHFTAASLTDASTAR